MELFDPGRYPVIEGSGSCAALCTCWTMPELLLKQHPYYKDCFALIGTLYGKEGVSVMLRNLCLNPQINTLFVLSDNPLSQTAFGSSGWKTLEALWKDGVEKNNIVKATGVRLHKEISPEAIREVIANVMLVKADGLSPEAVMGEAGKCIPNKQYMAPIGFPAPKRDTSAPWPSEEVGWSVHGKTVIDAWVNTIDRIMRYGSIKGTDYGNRQKELQVVTWTFDASQEPALPSWPPEIRELTGFNPAAIKEYESSLLNAELPSGTAYTYGQRLVNYKGVNQVEMMISRLKQGLQTRRAFASIPDSTEDHKHSSPPCLVFIQCSVTNDKLNMFATFRSHDMFKAAIPNAFALRGLLRHIAQKVSLPAGYLCIASNSAHIYEEEWEHALHLLHCERWQAPEKSFIIENIADVRGNVRIRTIENQISVELQGPDGTLDEWRGTTARGLLITLCHLDLLSHPFHYADIAIELAKAEACIKLGKQYIQDRALEIGGILLG